MILTRSTPTRPFEVLVRTFFSQFFASESVTSDVQLRQTIICVLAFLLTPCVFLLIQMFPQYQMVVILARRFGRPEMIDEMLQLMAALLVTYSMVTIGLIAVFVWDALTFNRRDAMVFGALPLGWSAIIGAKLLALGLLLLGTSAAVNLVTAVPFALLTADRLGVAALVRHFAGHLAATLGAAVCIFSFIVSIRGLIAVISGPRLAARAGSLLQFVFVGALLGFVVLLPSALKPMRPGFLATAGWLPIAWFMGLFEWLRGASGAEFVILAERAMLATSLALLGGIVTTVVGFRRQMQCALSPAARAGPLASARISRAIAHTLLARDRVARSVADFILLTIARNPAQQGRLP